MGSVFSSSSNEEKIYPDLPTRTRRYGSDWQWLQKSKLLAHGPSNDIRNVSRNQEDEDGDNCFSEEKLEGLVEAVKEAYETTDTENHSTKIQLLFACLTQVWAGIQLIKAAINLFVDETDQFKQLCNEIDRQFRNERARQSIIRLRNHVWEVERLTNRPADAATAAALDQHINNLVNELSTQGMASALDDVYSFLDGGHRGKMEQYVLHILRVLYNGMNCNNRLLQKEYGKKKAQEYIQKQYSDTKLVNMMDNVYRVLNRFDEDLETNLEKDFMEHYRDFAFLEDKYDWLHLHLTESHSWLGDMANYMYRTSDWAPAFFKEVGEFGYVLHYISKDDFIDPSDRVIRAARAALKTANARFNPTLHRFGLMATEMNAKGIPWWGLFYGDRNLSTFKFSGDLADKCSVVEWMDPFEWRVLVCGKK